MDSNNIHRWLLQEPPKTTDISHIFSCDPETLSRFLETKEIHSDRIQRPGVEFLHSSLNISPVSLLDG